MLSGCPKKPASGLDADFRANVALGTAPLTVQFADMSISGASPVTAWHWLFGDGAESMVQDSSHVYAAAGSYNVLLEVTTTAGNDRELKVKFITVSAASSEVEAKGNGEGLTETVTLSGGVPLVMVWIPGATFTMGSPDNEQDRFDEEGPQRSVTLDGFWIGKYELTQGQWKAVMGGANPSFFQGGQNGVSVDTNTDNRPVEKVSWNDVQAFISALNTVTGKTFRLPTEAEWEYACRAGTTTRFYWGDDPNYTAIDNYAWYVGNSDDETHDVGGKTANAFGLYDMSGNVWEWCADDWHDNYTNAPAGGKAWVDTPRGSDCGDRGGGWRGGGNCRSANHLEKAPSSTLINLGFRPAK